MAECAIPDCTKPATRRGWCEVHYRHWKKYGDPLLYAAPVRGLCVIDGCGRPHEAHGWCSQHYRRWKEYGDPHRGGPIRERRTPPADGLCTVDGCESPHVSRGWCSAHVARFYKHGDPMRSVPPSATYVAVHLRLTSVQGRAANYRCVDCGGTALDWSYMGGDPNELTDPSTGAAYSLDQGRYVPRCRPCHKRFDAI